MLPLPMTVKQRVVIIAGGQPEEGIDGYGVRLWVKERFKTRVENAMRKVNKRSRIRVWRMEKCRVMMKVRTDKEHEE